MKDVDRSGPCYNNGKGCDRRCVTSTYNCHSHCPEYKKWTDKITSENELVRKKKAQDADFNVVRIRSIKKTKKERDQQKNRWAK